MSKTVLIYYPGTTIAEKIPAETKIALGNNQIMLEEDIDRLGLVFPVIDGKGPKEMEDFVNQVLAKRDNSGLGYLFAIAEGKKAKGILSDLDYLLQNHGLALSYATVLEDETGTEKILKDLEKEEIYIAKRPPFWRIRKKLSK